VACDKYGNAVRGRLRLKKVSQFNPLRQFEAGGTNNASNFGASSRSTVRDGYFVLKGVKRVLCTE
jgi:hypothetical protein